MADKLAANTAYLGAINWDADVSYDAGVVVAYSGQLYTSILAGKGYIPSSSPTYWSPKETDALVGNTIVKRDANGDFSVRILSADEISFTDDTASLIRFNNVGLAVPSVTTRSAGTKIVLYQTLSDTAVDYAIGVATSTLWNSVSGASASFKWYAGTAEIASLSGGGTFTTSAIQLTDASTKLNKGSAHALRITTPSGYIDIGPANTSWAHFYTDRPGIYFEKLVRSDGGLQVGANGAYLNVTAAGEVTAAGNINTPTGSITAGTTARAADGLIQVLAADGYKAGFEARGSNQGTGYVYVGQEANHGGGIFYNGDGTPAFATGETMDRVSFFRRSGGTNYVVFDYVHNSDDVSFKGAVLASGGVKATNFEMIYNSTTDSLDFNYIGA